MNNDLIRRKMRLIDADALKEEVNKKKVIGRFSILVLIDNAPTVEEIPQGEWGKHGECPFCSYIKQWEDDKFCGNCGAMLRKGGEE